MDMSTDGPREAQDGPREAQQAADSGAAQPVGELIDFTPPARPDGRTLRGDPRIWTYLYEEPSPDLAACRAMRAHTVGDVIAFAGADRPPAVLLHAGTYDSRQSRPARVPTDHSHGCRGGRARTWQPPARASRYNPADDALEVILLLIPRKRYVIDVHSGASRPAQAARP